MLIQIENNLGSVGIEIAVLSVLAPSRSKVILKYATRGK